MPTEQSCLGKDRAAGKPLSSQGERRYDQAGRNRYAGGIECNGAHPVVRGLQLLSDRTRDGEYRWLKHEFPKSPLPLTLPATPLNKAQIEYQRYIHRMQGQQPGRAPAFMMLMSVSSWQCSHAGLGHSALGRDACASVRLARILRVHSASGRSWGRRVSDGWVGLHVPTGRRPHQCSSGRRRSAASAGFRAPLMATASRSADARRAGKAAAATNVVAMIAAKAAMNVAAPAWGRAADQARWSGHLRCSGELDAQSPDVEPRSVGLQEAPCHAASLSEKTRIARCCAHARCELARFAHNSDECGPRALRATPPPRHAVWFGETALVALTGPSGVANTIVDVADWSGMHLWVLHRCR